MENIWLISADYVDNHRITVVFNDGLQGVVDLQHELDLPIFQPLKELSYFKNFKQNSFTIYWENGADFAPEFLYEKVTQKENTL
jgi:hypothetical protein